MEANAIVNTFGLFVLLYLQFLLFHFMLYFAFWITGPNKLIKPFLKE